MVQIKQVVIFKKIIETPLHLIKTLDQAIEMCGSLTR